MPVKGEDAERVITWDEDEAAEDPAVIGEPDEVHGGDGRAELVKEVVDVLKVDNEGRGAATRR